MLLFRLLFLLTLSACYLRHYPLTPEVAKGATYKVRTPSGGGTAFAVSKHFLVSAGHVCEMEGPFVLHSGYRRIPVEPVLWWQDEGQRDICVLKTEISLDNWLVISLTMPKIGDKVGFVGYPLLEYGEGTGTYLGDIDGNEDMNDSATDAPCNRGASGSAFYHEGGVWGVLVRLRTDGGYLHDPSEGCVAVGLPVLLEILKEAGVPYTQSPKLDDIP